MRFATFGLTGSERMVARHTKVFYLEYPRLTLEQTGLVINTFNVRSTQPIYEEGVNKMELSLEQLWRIWVSEFEAQDFQLEECDAKEANAVVRVYRYSSRGPGAPKNRGAADCYLKSLTGKFVGKDFAGIRTLLNPHKHTVEYYEGSEKMTAEAEFKDYYIKIRKKN